jgi:hypothetical protein
MDTRWMPLVGGILDIISGVICLLVCLILALLGLFFSSSYDRYSGQDLSALAVWMLLFVPFFILSVLAIIGGIFALRKKVWGLALTGSICSILTLWVWPLGVASVIFISLSKRDFDRREYLFPPSVIPPPSSPPNQAPPFPPANSSPPLPPSPQNGNPA